MSTFELAIPTVMKHEGGFVNDPADPGGATNYGISLRWLKSIGDLDHDGFLDGDLDHDGDVDIDDIKKMKPVDAEKLYRQCWWDKYDYSKINDQAIATKVFDLAINMGAIQAHKLLQRACWSINGYMSISDDGALGDKSFSTINGANSIALLTAFRSETAGFYRELIAKKSMFERYRKGWLKRAYA